MHTELEALCDLTTRFGQRPGSDRFLIDRASMETWMDALAAASDRMRFVPIGSSTEEHQMWMMIVSSPETIREIDHVRDRRAALADPALLRDPAFDDGRQAGDKPVVLITAGIHATEVGGVQLMPELLALLASSNAPHIRDALDRVVLLVVPTLNPDGMDQVQEWYEKTVGTAAEGTVPPEVYHRYAGHDNNRDWYTHVLSETRSVIDHVHRPWRPNVVLDLHQMGELAPRYVLPPFIDPVEPHVHPLITGATSALGATLAAAHQRQGHAGVASGVMFDSYSPTRSYQTYHGGIRILAEAASAKIASPIHLERAHLEVRRGFDQRLPGVHNPRPWHGGTWRLRDIMDYHLVTIDTLLDDVASHADRYLRDQWTVLAEETRNDQRPVYAIAPLRQQTDPRAARDLVEILRRGDVAVEYAEEGDQMVSRGSIIVRSGQPFGAYARALLDLTPYPELASNPYDVTSHCLPVHMGVEVQTLPSDTSVDMRHLSDRDLDVFPPVSAATADRSRWLAVDHRSHAAIRIVAHALRNGADVRRLHRPHFDGGRILQPGTWMIAGEHALDGMSRASQETVRTWLIAPVERGTIRHRLPRVGVYIPWREDAIDSGWLRLMLEHSALHYTVVRDAHIRSGALDDLDVLLLADQEPDALLSGNSSKTYPAEFSGGIGNAGTSALLQWVTDGGTLVAIDGAARALAAPLGLPVRFPLASMPKDTYAAPGSIVSVVPDTAHPLMLGIDEPFPVMLQGASPFGSRRPHDEPRFAAGFHPDTPLLSGWMRGEDLIAGLGAVTDHQIGRGNVVAFAFRPHFRTQMLASYGPLINSIMRAGAEMQQGDHE